MSVSTRKCHQSIFTTSVTLGRWPVQPHLYKRPQHRQSISIFYTSCDFSISLLHVHFCCPQLSLSCFYPLYHLFLLTQRLLPDLVLDILHQFSHPVLLPDIFHNLCLLLLSIPEAPPDVFSFMISTWCILYIFFWSPPEIFYDLLHDFHLMFSMNLSMISTWCLPWLPSWSSPDIFYDYLH